MARFSRILLSKALLLACAFSLSSSPGARAETSVGPVGPVGPAERRAAIERILESRSREESTLARATVAMHQSLTSAERLTREALHNVDDGSKVENDDAIRALILEGRRLRVVYEVVRPSLGRTRGPEQRRAPLRVVRAGSEASRADAHRATRPLVTPGTAFDHVERVLGLISRVERTVGSEASARVIAALRELQLETSRSLRAIRPGPPRISGVAHGSATRIEPFGRGGGESRRRP